VWTGAWWSCRSAAPVYVLGSFAGVRKASRLHAVVVVRPPSITLPYRTWFQLPCQRCGAAGRMYWRPLSPSRKRTRWRLEGKVDSDGLDIRSEAVAGGGARHPGGRRLGTVDGGRMR